MKGKFRSKLALVLALSMVVSAVPGVGALAKAKKSTKAKVETAVNKKDDKQTIADGTYRIMTALDTSKGLDLANNSTSNGTNVQLYQVTYTDCWFFEVKYQGSGYYKICVPNTNMVLDQAGGEQRDGANLQIYTDNGTWAQRWRIVDAGDGFYNIRSGLDGRAVDIYNSETNNRTNVHLWSFHGDKNQKWKFEAESKPVADGQYRIMTFKNPAMGLDLLNDKQVSGGNVKLWTLSDVDVNLFEVTYDKKGFYKIGVPGKNLVLDHSGSTKEDGANVIIYTSNDTPNQRWRFEDAGNGSYYIRSGVDGRCLDYANGIAENNRNVFVWSYYGADNQKWLFQEDNMPKLEDITPFSIVGGLRIRWGKEGDPNNKLYKIDRTFPKGSSSSAIGSSFLSVSSDPAGIDVKYRENEVDAQWKEVDLQAQNGTYVDLKGLNPGVEYFFSIRPYYQYMVLGLPVGGKIYKQDWSPEQKRKTMEGNEGDIGVGDNGRNTIAAMAMERGWYAGMHSQLLTGYENNLYAMVCKNPDFQIWVGYQYIKSKICYSWEISDYTLTKYKWVYRGTLNQLKKDLTTYGPGSSKVRLSTELLTYKKNKEYTITIKNSSKNVTWSLPKSKDDRIKYGGVEIVKKNTKSITIRFVKVKGEYGVYPYIEAKVGDETLKCYIESGSHPRW